MMLMIRWSAGTMIFVFLESALSMTSSCFSVWAFPVKYFWTASLMSRMASAAPSASRIRDCLIPSDLLMAARRSPSA